MSCFGLHVSVKRNEQLVCEYYDERFVINGPQTRWLMPFTRYTKRSAVILEETQYAVIKDEYTGALETLKGGHACPPPATHPPFLFTAFRSQKYHHVQLT